MTRRSAGLLLAIGVLLSGGCGGGRAAAPGAPSAGGAQAPGNVPFPANLPGRFEVVGRGPVTRTGTTDLWVFRAPNGRDYAYTGTLGFCTNCFGDRLYVWDVSEPSRPVLTDSVMVDARVINDVVVNAAGTLAVITREGAQSRRNGMVVLDLADPAHPRQLSEYWETLTGGVHNVSLSGSHAYVVDEGTQEMVVVDLTNPRDPREVGRWGVTFRPGRILHDLFVRDGLAYLAYWDDGLVILDVGNGIKDGTPQKPKLVSQFRYRTEWRGNKYGNTHYAFPYTNAAGKRYVFVGDEIMPDKADLDRYVPTGGYLHVIDVGNPEVPLEVATYEVPNTGVHNFWVERDTLYMGAYSGGVRALDVSGDLRGSLRNREIAAIPTTDARARVANLPMTWGAMPHRGLVYATDLNSGLWVLRLSPNPGAAAPAPASRR